MFIHHKMLYECGDCGYVSNRHLNFLRHKNRKNFCGNIIHDVKNEAEVNINAARENINVARENINAARENINVFGENINVGNSIVSSEKYTCIKCRKTLSDKRSFDNHLNSCKGVNGKTCPTCFKVFSTVQGKFQHMKKVKCKPPALPSSAMIASQQITNNNNNNITYNTNNITNNTITNNNIHINVFGKEDLDYLLSDPNIIHKLKYFGKSGIYGLPKILDDVHFNKNKPENHTLIKPDEYGNGVMILNDANEWEYREFEDIRDNLINTIIKYFRAYNNVKKNLGIKLVEKKERNIIKNIAYELMALDGSIPQDLFEELGMNEDGIEETDEELKIKLRKFDKSTMKNMHYKTTLNFKKENGTYVKKND